MAEGYYTDQIPGLSMHMESLAVQDNQNMGAKGRLTLPFPVELNIQVAGHLAPAHDTVQTGYAGSDALHAALTGLDTLQALCRVSRRVGAFAKQVLYRSIVITNPYKLHLLLRSLQESLELGEHIQSLTVCRDFNLSDTQDKSLRQFSKALVAVLQNTPNIVTLTLNVNKMMQFRDSTPFGLFKRFLKTDISRAKRALVPQEFLPKVVNLGVLLPPGEASEVQRSEEYEIFNDLLNLPSLSHIVVRRPEPAGDVYPGHEIYGQLLGQRREPLRHTIKSVDLQVPRRMPWDDIGGIISMFPALDSLAVSHTSHERSNLDLPPGWPGLIRMECLRELSIDITSPEGWSHCQWFFESIQYRFNFAPMLETLRIPLRLLRDPFEESGAMLIPTEVLPRTLKSLIFFADLKIFELYDPDGEGIPPVQDYPFAEEIRMPYPIVCHLSVPWTLQFLEDIEKNSPDYFSHLENFALNYEINRLSHDHPCAAVVKPILDDCKQFFVAEVQALRRNLRQKGIDFNSTRL